MGPQIKAEALRLLAEILHLVFVSLSLDRFTNNFTIESPSNVIIPRLTAEADGGMNQNWRSSDLMVYDGSFLLVKELGKMTP